jgi:hypothetical protein
MTLFIVASLEHLSPKIGGILFETVCTSPLLDIHRLEYVSETFIEV